VHTIAGGIVLEPDAPKRKRLGRDVASDLARLIARDDGAIAALLALAGPAGVRAADLPLLTGLAPDVIDSLMARASGAAVVGDRIVAAAHLEDCRHAILRALSQCHGQQPLDEAVDREVLRRQVGLGTGAALFDAALQQLLSDGTVLAIAGGVALHGHIPTATPAQRRALEALTAIFAAAGMQPPELAELPAELGDANALLPLLRYLERQRTLVRLAPSRWADAAATAAAAARLHAHLPAGQELGVGELKAVLGLSRKHLIPLLEYFDRVGVCMRRGETRVLSAAEAPDAPARRDAPGSRAAKP
jgi:selenocysteine-specific elongation factor